MALELDIIQKEMVTLQNERLSYFCTVIGCERAFLYFLNESANELILFANDRWYRTSASSGFAGHCVEFGEILNVTNAVNDSRYQKHLDDITGANMHNIMCHPVRANRGGGKIIGVVQMINKIKVDQEFDQHDEDALGDCVQRVCEDLDTRFRELLDAAGKLSSRAIFVGDVSTHNQYGHNIYQPTAASIAARRDKADPKLNKLNDIIHKPGDGHMLI